MGVHWQITANRRGATDMASPVKIYSQRLFPNNQYKFMGAPILSLEEMKWILDEKDCEFLQETRWRLIALIENRGLL